MRNVVPFKAPDTFTRVGIDWTRSAATERERKLREAFLTYESSCGSNGLVSLLLLATVSRRSAGASQIARHGHAGSDNIHTTRAGNCSDPARRTRCSQIALQQRRDRSVLSRLELQLMMRAKPDRFAASAIASIPCTARKLPSSASSPHAT